MNGDCPFSFIQMFSFPLPFMYMYKYISLYIFQLFTFYVDK